MSVIQSLDSLQWNTIVDKEKRKYGQKTREFRKNKVFKNKPTLELQIIRSVYHYCPHNQSELPSDPLIIKNTLFNETITIQK